ncbi:DUF1534 domain-containing protein [Pseudomonas syringae]|nr:DUF1534 domain-containing protein [Pseudomonas syringae]
MHIRELTQNVQNVRPTRSVGTIVIYLTTIVPHARCGNAFRDAPRHNSAPHCTFKS